MQVVNQEPPSNTVAVSFDPPDRVPLLWQVERAAVLHAIRVHGGNKTKAARALGIGRTTITRKMNEFRTMEIASHIEGSPLNVRGPESPYGAKK